MEIENFGSFGSEFLFMFLFFVWSLVLFCFLFFWIKELWSFFELVYFLMLLMVFIIDVLYMFVNLLVLNIWYLVLIV